MNTTKLLGSIIAGLALSVTAAAADDATIAGDYTCEGHSSMHLKKFKGDFNVQSGSGSFATTWTYADGSKDTGTLKATDTKNVYVQHWNSESGPATTGLSRWTDKGHGKLQVEYVAIDDTTGKLMRGMATCQMKKS